MIFFFLKIDLTRKKKYFEIKTLFLKTGWDPICSDRNGNGQLDVVSLLNVAWSILQNSKEKVKKITDLESQVNGFFKIKVGTHVIGN